MATTIDRCDFCGRTAPTVKEGKYWVCLPCDSPAHLAELADYTASHVGERDVAPFWIWKREEE